MEDEQIKLSPTPEKIDSEPISKATHLIAASYSHYLNNSAQAETMRLMLDGKINEKQEDEAITGVKTITDAFTQISRFPKSPETTREQAFGKGAEEAAQELLHRTISILAAKDDAKSQNLAKRIEMFMTDSNPLDSLVSVVEEVTSNLPQTSAIGKKLSNFFRDESNSDRIMPEYNIVQLEDAI
jgi:hypothetical protein